MSASRLLQAPILLVCLGVLGLMVAATIAVRIAYSRRAGSAGPNNSAVRPLNQPPFVDEDFGGVPTTGSVQEYERDAPSEQIIGSSGFTGQADSPPDDEDDSTP